MPRLYHRKARTDRYKFGRKIETDTVIQGFKIDFSKPRIPFDELICEMGEFYYTWHPRGSSWQFSKEKPDLRPEWEKTAEDFQIKVDECVESGGDIDQEDLIQEIEEMRDELQSRLDNIPEQLQESSVLNERIEELEAFIESLNSIDFE